MKFHALIISLIVVAFSITGYYACVSSTGSSIQHKNNEIYYTLSILGIVLISTILTLLFFFLKRKFLRNYSTLIFALSFGVLAFTTQYISVQHDKLIKSLESIYDTISKKGAPYPSIAEVQKLHLAPLPNTYSTGYWVSPDRETFEIYYHLSSDSFVMKSPEQTWLHKDHAYRTN